MKEEARTCEAAAVFAGSATKTGVYEDGRVLEQGVPVEKRYTRMPTEPVGH